jgi:competence protein ComEC
MVFYSNQKTYISGEKVNFITQVLATPKVYSSYQTVYVSLDPLTKVLIKTAPYPELTYGDSLKITGTLKTLSLKDSATIFTLDYPKIEANPRENSQLLAVFYKLRQKIITVFQSTLDPVSSGLLLGIVFGIKDNLPKEFLQNIQITGVMHVIAASGMNLTMAAGFIFYSLVLILKRQQAIVLSILGIILYTALAGFQPSIIRAAIMAILVFSAQILGRQQRALNTLLLTGFVMLLVFPQYLFDIGFQLSFAATFGLVYLPDFFKRIKNRLTGDFITTTSAQIATLPLLITNFGNYSLWSVVVNGLVLWTIPVLMVLGFFAAISGFIFMPLARVFLYLCLPFLLFFEKVVSFFGTFGSTFTFSSIPWQFSAAYYCILLSLIVFRFSKSSKQ